MSWFWFKTSWPMWLSAAPQQHFTSLQFKGEVLLHSPSTQGQALTMLILDARVNPCYARLWPKCESSLSLSMMQGQSLHSPSTQGRGLTTLVLDTRATLTMLSFNPSVSSHYLCPWCKGEVSLCCLLTQGWGLMMLILNPRVSQNYPHPQCKSKVSLCLPSIQEVNPHFTQFCCKASIIALY